MNDNIVYDPSRNIWILRIERQMFWYSNASVPLGRGGMGEVYLGREWTTSRPVAIKKVHERYANIPEIRRRARTEAGMTFRHGNLIEMIGCCESISGQGPLFIISNYVNGSNIDKFIAANFSGMDCVTRQRKIVELLFPVLSALEFVHGYNIVHLDIKPSNIMIENGCNVRLMDLGIALVSDSATTFGVPSGNANGTGLMGTPKYAAPEQFGNDFGTGPINASTDIYEFGVMLYELLSGINPFIGNTLKETIDNHLHRKLPYSANMTSEMYDVLTCATHPDQRLRYSNVGQLREALQEALYPKPQTLLTRIKSKLWK